MLKVGGIETTYKDGIFMRGGRSAAKEKGREKK